MSGPPKAWRTPRQASCYLAGVRSNRQQLGAGGRHAGAFSAELAGRLETDAAAADREEGAIIFQSVHE
jgi:hypothetical protein